MNKLTLTAAKEYAKEKFSELDPLMQEWNTIHSRGIIAALELLSCSRDELIAVAWVHDVGKVRGEEDHARQGLLMLEQDFLLDAVARECIAEHGSGGNPKTKEGKLFRCADGLSLFIPEVVRFRYFAEGKEGLSFAKINQRMEKLYAKYKGAYAENELALGILEKLWSALAINTK
ncbi:MAG: hypothetical protein H6502_03860 [Candidatus Woesearchaeota archaeon]|nr:MAG: hypothetical protein H6502_03860 [Candidatus Woesearchaeota archaeon]